MRYPDVTRFGIGRRAFALCVVAYFAALIGVVVAALASHRVDTILEAHAALADFAFDCLLAVMTSARLADAGYPLWLGAAGAAAISLMDPISKHWSVWMLVPLPPQISGWFLQAMTFVWWLALIALLVWVGMRPSVALSRSLPEQVFGDGAPPRP
jgi:hypothetical protein